ncbi:DUF3817 domain-containing protein [Haloechinothrix sp. YIM 98757]|uniref:DUF3817 domain-containing protein n=1 Tax=Haloechinothrix aidingensis TaxID=2752311 RepID=A0A838A8H9_9PSEU|nr:DUF3817 domain-containing protein [Haloechinothrix aidingensis]MBA0125057.1 DUF3817 domain-containing protein [Haloechinothrix aidingensis]
MFGKAAAVFRLVAVAEALSWVGLLVAMFAKYVVGLGEGGVPVAGMVHGIMFIAYIVVTLAVFRALDWNARTLLLAVAAGVPPLFTWWFEVWALRSGRLDSPGCVGSGGVALFTVRGPATA